MHGGGHVRREGPWGRRPDDQLPARSVLERKGHEDGAVAHLLVSLRQLVAREDGAAARAVGKDAMTAVEEPAVVQPAEKPPDRLDVLVAEGDVRMRIVEPVPDPVGQRFPVGLVGKNAAPAQRVEPLDAVLLDRLLPLQPELLFHLDFHRQSMGVPAGDARDGPPLHGAEPADEVLDRARKDVMDARPPVGGGRPLVEHERRAGGPCRHAPAEEVFGLPGLEQLLLELVGAEFGKGRKSHQGSRSGEALTPAS